MATYHVDLDLYQLADFVDRTGAAAENSATPYTGAAGLQAAIRGTGAATAVAAGDTVYIKGLGNLGQLVLIDCGDDLTSSGLGWNIGDYVQSAGGAGSSDFYGRIVETNDGGKLGDNTYILVWLDQAFDAAAIEAVKANGIENMTAPNAAETSTVAAATTPGIIWDGATGTNVSNINIIGVNDLWAEDGTAATLDGAYKAANCIFGSSNVNYFVFRNLTLKDAVGDCIGFSGQWRYDTHVNCSLQGAGSDGIKSGGVFYCVFEFCTFCDCGGYGVYGYSSICFGCTFYNNAIGAQLGNGSSVNYCVFFENATYGAYFLAMSSAANCVFDKNAVGIYVNQSGGLVACRITNNTIYGLQGATASRDPYCFYSGNGANFQNAIYDDTVRGVSTRVTAGVVGYIDNDDATPNDQRNYGLTNLAAARRQEATL